MPEQSKEGVVERGEAQLEVMWRGREGGRKGGRQAGGRAGGWAGRQEREGGREGDGDGGLEGGGRGVPAEGQFHRTKNSKLFKPNS